MTQSAISKMISPSKKTNDTGPLLSPKQNDENTPTRVNQVNSMDPSEDSTVIHLSVAQLQELIKIEIQNSKGSSTPTTLSADTASTPPADTTSALQAILSQTAASLTTLSQSLKGNRFDKLQEFPKFDGTNYPHWKTLMLCQLSTHPWEDIFDEMQGSWMKVTTDANLDKQLYKQLLRCLEGNVLSYVITCKKINGKGLALLEELDSVYKIYPTAPYLEKLLIELREFTRKTDESVDEYDY